MPERPLANLHHIALTVTSFAQSVPWYERVFGIQPQMDAPHQGGVGRLLADPAWKLIIVLHEHDTNQGERFAETRTGLDHVGFRVSSRAELEAWVTHLEEQGVARQVAADRPLTQSPIVDTPYGSVLVFRDPDNIQLEFFSDPGT